MKVYLCLVLGASFLLTIDATNEDDRAECIKEMEKCNADLPRGIRNIVNEAGELDVDCSTLENDRDCLRNLLGPDASPNCRFLRDEGITEMKSMRYDIKEYLCSNRRAFLTGKACWKSKSLEMLRDCNICRMRPCMEEKFGTSADCFDVEAGLLSGIANRTLHYRRQCPAQTDQLPNEDQRQQP